MPTSSPSIRAQIGVALADRLATIQTANGYDHTIKSIFQDKIPQGIDLEEKDLPAILILDEGGIPTHKQQDIEYARSYRLQIVDSEVPDTKLAELMRAVNKAIFANHPTANITSEFRFHPRVYQVELGVDETDLFMIEANRIATFQIVVHYRTKPYDL
jgi:hypothetical protein